MPLSNEELSRYSRHLILPGIGMEGQEKLKNSAVLIVGAGGTGSSAAMYLTSAGIGKIGIIDFDIVDMSNLQRQIIYSTEDIGRNKTDSAFDKLRLLNPHTEVKKYNTKLTTGNALDIFPDYDIIVDCSDNFPTTYLVNDACIILGKPDVYGSVYKFEGKVSVFGTSEGPCYRCLYPASPPQSLIPNCDEGGVLNIVPGITGTMQALEVIKLITGIGNVLAGKVLFFDLLNVTFNEVKLEKDPGCPLCGEKSINTELIDYDEFCGIKKPAFVNDIEISVLQLHEKIIRGENIVVLDVRNKYEYELVNTGGYLIPLDQLERRFGELNTDAELVVLCKTGRRSQLAVKLLKEKGFKNVKNLTGGIKSWIAEIDNSLPYY